MIIIKYQKYSIMSKYCGTSGGKGNFGMFSERDKKICAAGVPTSQHSNYVASSLEHYLMQEEVDALLSDSIIPSVKPQKLLPLRRPPIKDMRNAGPFTEAATLINPPNKTKFETLIDDFKETCYASYWKKTVGKVSDPVPILPHGFNVMTTLGKKLPPCEQLYDVVMPKVPLPDKTPLSKSPGYQTNRKYCAPGYNPNMTFGTKVNVDPRGKFVKSCLHYENIKQGNFMKIPASTVLSNFQDRKRSQLSIAMEPNHNISCLRKGYAFGDLQPPSNVVECLTTCDLNPDRQFYLKCLAHLNIVRKFLSKRFESTFFRRFYLNLRYCDESKTGWLPKEIVYKYCNDILIRINPTLLEPLLSMWNAFNGTNIEYNIFTNIINFTLVTPELPKVWDVSESCLDFRTTYKEMVKPDQEVYNRRMAGLPSGRYFDKDNPVTPNGYSSADRICLPHESDAKICLNPSVMTLLGVSHRDMYAKRDKDTVRKVFERAGEKFDDDQFNVIWDNSRKYHLHGWVSFETFRRSVIEVTAKVTK
ncbi:unnamed protein product [Chilo suppressalis]|uniref:EFHB C-terminal EF-hand domain-containing protein n=1 Tax=Chilo suppressalis TaxID=168631 RepID=A0ABN8L726_CHISP|nr:unnamed protein product [Chilo suppressalis]